MRTKRELPVWALPVIIVCCLAVVALIGWRSLAESGEVGPRREVHAGMYDMRQEIEKARLAQEPARGAQTPSAQGPTRGAQTR